MVLFLLSTNYSGVPNKRAARLLILVTFFLPTLPYQEQHVYLFSRNIPTNSFIWTNMFIEICTEMKKLRFNFTICVAMKA